MNGDDEIRRMFDGVDFRDEPPMTSMATDDARRGQRYVRRRRAAVWSSSVAGVAALATAGALVLPGGGGGADSELQVAGGTTPESAATEDSGVPEDTGAGDTEPAGHPDIAFPATRELLLATAAEHFDPDGEHLPDETSNAQEGGGPNGDWSVGTKLGWTVPGESGLGLVQVAVTTAEYASFEEHALDGFASNLGCEIGTESCTEETIPGADGTVWVSEGDTGRNLRFSVIHERTDGSLVGVAVHDLFGNNSTEPVSEMDIEHEDAFAFVTDPDLQVDPNEADEAWAKLDTDDSRTDDERSWADVPAAEDLDFSSTQEAPAPEHEDMSQAEAQDAIDACVADVPDWEGFEAFLGVRTSAEVEQYEPVSLALAERGGTRLLCELDSSGQTTGGSLFGSSDAKDSPYVTAPVVSKSSPYFGLYTSSVAQVTVQTDGGPEQDAIMRDGYWFLPHDAQDSLSIALRGYDESGELVYDSTADGLDKGACYTDPEGEEVLRLGQHEDPAPEDCEPMLEWDH